MTRSYDPLDLTGKQIVDNACHLPVWFKVILILGLLLGFVLLAGRVCGGL
jgi:hypothetical protein